MSTIPKEIVSALRDLSENGVKAVQTAVENGLDVSANDRGETLLHLAAIYGNYGAVRSLLSKGADPKLKNRQDGFIPLHWACCGKGEQAIEIIDLLLDAGSDVNTKAKWKVTPVHTAAYWGKLEIVKHLISRGAKPELQDDKGNNALHEAAKLGQTDTVRYLLTLGLDVNCKNRDNQTPLHLAVDFPGWNYIEKADRTETVRCLLENGADRTSTDLHGLTPLDSARNAANSDQLNEKEKISLVSLLETF